MTEPRPTSARYTPSPALELGSALRARVAAVDDARALAAFAERAFRDTYGGASGAADVDAYVGAHFGVAQQTAELRDAAIRTLLLEDAAGVLVGYAQLRLTPAAGAPVPGGVQGAAPVELARFYVDRSWHGRGAAQQLLAAVDAELAGRPLGAEPLWLSVYQENPRAIAFYRRAGFVAVGEATFQLGGELQHDWVLARIVLPAAPR